MTSDGWLAGPLGNLAPPFWCAEEAESKRKTNTQANQKKAAKLLLKPSNKTQLNQCRTIDDF